MRPAPTSARPVHGLLRQVRGLPGPGSRSKIRWSGRSMSSTVAAHPGPVKRHHQTHVPRLHRRYGCLRRASGKRAGLGNCARLATHEARAGKLDETSLRTQGRAFALCPLPAAMRLGFIAIRHKAQPSTSERIRSPRRTSQMIGAGGTGCLEATSPTSTVIDMAPIFVMAEPPCRSVSMTRQEEAKSRQASEPLGGGHQPGPMHAVAR